MIANELEGHEVEDIAFRCVSPVRRARRGEISRMAALKGRPYVRHTSAMPGQPLLRFPGWKR